MIPLNQTIPPELIVSAHQTTAVPALVIFFIVMAVLHIAINMTRAKKKWTKWLMLWGLGLLVLVALINFPMVIQNVSNVFLGVLK